MDRTFGTIASLTILLATSTQAAPVTIAMPKPFKTTGQYVAFCSDTKLSQGCYGGYEAALVELIVGKKITNLCAPSQSGAGSDEAKYLAAEALEIPRYVDWLKAHPNHMRQDYRTGLGYAIVAIYGCK